MENKKLEVVYKKLEDLKPYAKNPRLNDEAVQYVANSIKKFGFKVPIIIDKKGEIIAGHTRYKASIELGLQQVPCIIADDLTEEQIKAFRIADNKVADKAEWNDDLLGEEIKDLMDDFDMTDFGFGEFELSILTDDMEPDSYDDELIQQYSSNSDDFLLNKRVIVTYKTDEETEFLKNLFKEDNELGVVYKIEDIMGRYNE